LLATLLYFQKKAHREHRVIVSPKTRRRKTMNNGIEGKVVVITGASSGLGESAARHLAKRGASVVLGARRKARLDAIAKDIEAEGGKALAVVADVTKRADVEALVMKAVSAFGKIDVLVNNAGIMPIAPLALLKVDEWDQMVDLNIKSVLYGVAAALPQMKKQQSGHFINIASVFGIKVFAPGGTVYCATKAAVRALSEGLRMEVHGDKIRTTIINPGAVESELKESTSDPESSKGVKQLYQAWAISADSIARAIAYAIEQPADVDVNEIVIRPVAQDF
jgi:NADP-dependent 3-hydroxy acid dehydrogenase YdfG